jgi:spermidine synthase
VFISSACAHLNGREQINTLFIDGGGCTFPRYIQAVFPTAAVDVIEIDPAVTDTARQHLGLADNTHAEAPQ